MRNAAGSTSEGPKVRGPNKAAKGGVVKLSNWKREKHAYIANNVLLHEKKIRKGITILLLRGNHNTKKSIVTFKEKGCYYMALF